MSLIYTAFPPPELSLALCFLYFAPFCVNATECCVWNSKEIRSFWNAQSRPTFLLDFSPRALTEAFDLHVHDFMIGWLDNCINAQVFLIKWTVSVFHGDRLRPLVVRLHEIHNTMLIYAMWNTLLRYTWLHFCIAMHRVTMYRYTPNLVMSPMLAPASWLMPGFTHGLCSVCFDPESGLQ